MRSGTRFPQGHDIPVTDHRIAPAWSVEDVLSTEPVKIQWKGIPRDRRISQHHCPGIMQFLDGLAPGNTLTVTLEKVFSPKKTVNLILI